jgi:hypothetical protein
MAEMVEFDDSMPSAARQQSQRHSASGGSASDFDFAELKVLKGAVWAMDLSMLGAFFSPRCCAFLGRSSTTSAPATHRDPAAQLPTGTCVC